MGKGRKATPNKILALKGGRSHTHRAPRKEISPPPEIPTCPKHLDKVAKKEWKRAVKLLAGVSVMTGLDRATLAAYCEAYSRWVNATIKVQEEGEIIYFGREFDDAGNITKQGFPKANPYVKIQKESLDQVIKIGKELAMSPSSRASLSISNQKPTKAADKNEAFRQTKYG